jgi:hypothetical protein
VGKGVEAKDRDQKQRQNKKKTIRLTVVKQMDRVPGMQYSTEQPVSFSSLEPTMTTTMMWTLMLILLSTMMSVLRQKLVSNLMFHGMCSAQVASMEEEWNSDLNLHSVNDVRSME